MGGRAFVRARRGVFAGGQVRGLVEDAGTAIAKVRGSRDYRVKLWVEKGEIAFSCTCPVGAEGVFCKHGVAVGLAWLEQPVLGARVSHSSPKTAVTMEDVRADLSCREKKELVDLLMEQAMEDDRLRRRLLMKAAKRGGKDLDLAAYRQAIDQAVDSREFVDYGAAHDYARGIDEVIDSVEALLKEGYAAEVVELSEHALRSVEEALGSVDDSEGDTGGFSIGSRRFTTPPARRPNPTLRRWASGSLSGNFALIMTLSTARRSAMRMSLGRKDLLSTSPMPTPILKLPSSTKRCARTIRPCRGRSGG